MYQTMYTTVTHYGCEKSFENADGTEEDENVLGLLIEVGGGGFPTEK